VEATLKGRTYLVTNFFQLPDVLFEPSLEVAFVVMILKDVTWRFHLMKRNRKIFNAARDRGHDVQHSLETERAKQIDFLQYVQCFPLNISNSAPRLLSSNGVTAKVAVSH
jgi:hypothetical protein